MARIIRPKWFKHLRIWLALLLLMAACAPAPAPSAPAAPAAQEATQAEATPAPAPAAEPIPLRFGMLGSENEFNHIRKQLAEFEESHPDIFIEDAVRWETLEQFLAVLMAGDAPDVVGGIWYADARRIQDEFAFFQVLSSNEMNLGDYLASAQRAVRLEEELALALPWHAYLCLQDYSLLGVNQMSEQLSAAIVLASYLSEAQPQSDNLASLGYWYPTRRDVNSAVGCPDDNERIVRQVTGEQRQLIASTIEGDLIGLEDALKGSDLWPPDQPTTLDYTRATGIVGDNDNVLVGAVPVSLVDNSDFFLESNLAIYFEGQGGEAQVIVGALRVYPGAPLENVPEGIYAVAWKAFYKGDGSWQDEQFLLLDSNGALWAEGSITSLQGEAPSEPADPTRQVLRPFVVLVEGSWLLEWLFDSRGGWCC